MRLQFEASPLLSKGEGNSRGEVWGFFKLHFSQKNLLNFKKNSYNIRFT
jgi:hypothetical protein